MRWRHLVIGRDIIVWVTQSVGAEEDKASKDQQEDADRKRILDCVVRMEWKGFFLHILDFNTGWVVVARHMQRPDVQDHDACNDERQEIMQREEAVQCRIVDGKATEQPRLDRLTNERNRTHDVGDHGCTPQGHLTPRQYVTHEGRNDHQQEDDDTQAPQNFARGFVRAIIKATEDVDVNGQEEHAGPVGVHEAHQPAIINVPHDAFNRIKGHIDLGHVMHRQDDPGDDLADQTDRQNAAERVPIVQVLWGWKIDQRVIHKPHDRQPRIQPLFEVGLRHIA